MAFKIEICSSNFLENNIFRAKWLSRLKSTAAVSTLIGLSWVLGISAIGDASFTINVAFALFNSLQVVKDRIIG